MSAIPGSHPAGRTACVKLCSLQTFDVCHPSPVLLAATLRAALHALSFAPGKSLMPVIHPQNLLQLNNVL
tara:strand:- start:1241 stop:1450 length:210 start_codon:yes stop_codon:yes gene_type:complete